MPRTYTYQSTLNIDYWSTVLKQLRRRLTKKDRKIIRSTRYEKKDNESMEKILKRAIGNGLHIPCLTGLVGDCMFESIKHTGFCDDHTELRKIVATIFFMFGDCKILANQDESLKTLFSFYNDIEYVYCYKKNRLYRYTYYTMCSDMYTSGSWSRLPTEIILRVMSVFFKVRFNIYHDNGAIDKICDEAVEKNCNDIIDINLALIGENHYVPLTPFKGDPKKIRCPKYTTRLKVFHRWARQIADEAGLYIDEPSDQSESSDSDQYDSSDVESRSSVNNTSDRQNQSKVDEEKHIPHNTPQSINVDKYTVMPKIAKVVNTQNKTCVSTVEDKTSIKSTTKNVKSKSVDTTKERDIQSFGPDINNLVFFY